MKPLETLVRRSAAAFAALFVAAAGYLMWRSAAPAATLAHRPAPPVDWSALPAATITVDRRRAEITIELPPVDLPPGHAGGHHGVDLPAAVGEFPVGGAIFGFRAEAVDATGRLLPTEAIHHFNVMDPADRELFLPIARRLLAIGKETGVVRLPWLLVGARFRQGERILANAMLHNPTGEAYRGVRVRMVVSYTPERRPWPLFSGLPWQLDVAFPVGDKSFDLPPGRSERVYEGSPAVPGSLVVIGGHLHEYGQIIELWDATADELIWHGEPAPAAGGKTAAVPIGRLYGFTRKGAHITPTHRYRVRVVYDNPTGEVVQAGGMGVVAGLFIPDRGAVWPSADQNDSLYQQDLRHFLGGEPMRARAAAHPHAGH
jgi:hypothetical protein